MFAGSFQGVTETLSARDLRGVRRRLRHRAHDQRSARSRQRHDPPGGQAHGLHGHAPTRHRPSSSLVHPRASARGRGRKRSRSWAHPAPVRRASSGRSPGLPGPSGATSAAQTRPGSTASAGSTCRRRNARSALSSRSTPSFPTSTSARTSPSAARRRVSTSCSSGSASTISHRLDRRAVRRRTAAGRACSRARTRSAVLLLDEPLSALDAHTKTRVRGGAARAAGRVRPAALLVTHDFEDASTLADRVGVIVDGRLVQLAAAGRAHRLPGRPFVASLGGANLLRGVARPGEQRPRRDHAHERRAHLLHRRGRGRGDGDRLPVGDLDCARARLRVGAQPHHRARSPRSSPSRTGSVSDSARSSPR